MSEESIYAPTWEKLKREGTVILTAHRKLHPRIKKAIAKRKNIDLGFKIKVIPNKVILRSESKGSILIFKLEYHLSCLSPEDI